jgi:hypothetical protein
MSIHIMRNLLGKFNRTPPSILLAMFSKNNTEMSMAELANMNIDIRLVTSKYNIYMFPINLIVTDEANEQIMSTSYKLHCPVLMVTDKTIGSSNNNNLYICDMKSLKEKITDLIYTRFILK